MRAVPESNWVTMHWLDMSCNLGHPVRAMSRDRVMCRPLPHALPLPGFPSISCAPRDSCRPLHLWQVMRPGPCPCGAQQASQAPCLGAHEMLWQPQRKRSPGA